MRLKDLTAKVNEATGDKMINEISTELLKRYRIAAYDAGHEAYNDNNSNLADKRYAGAIRADSKLASPTRLSKKTKFLYHVTSGNNFFSILKDGYIGGYDVSSVTRDPEYFIYASPIQIVLDRTALESTHKIIPWPVSREQNRPDPVSDDESEERVIGDIPFNSTYVKGVNVLFPKYFSTEIKEKLEKLGIPTGQVTSAHMV